MSAPSPRPGVTVGITNTRLSASKRGLALTLGQLIAARARCGVCVVSADPTDRDVERRLPDLLRPGDGHSSVNYKEGTRSLDITHVPEVGLYVVCVHDRQSVETVVPELRAMFRFVVIDAPSRVGCGGIGIARGLLHHLDVLLIASGVRVEELTDARIYVDELAHMPASAPVDIGLLAIGEVAPGGLTAEQLRRRLAALPTVARLPRAPAKGVGPTDDSDPLGAVIELLARRETRQAGESRLGTPRHVAYDFYRRAMTNRC
jgi:hypothetical protein